MYGFHVNPMHLFGLSLTRWSLCIALIVWFYPVSAQGNGAEDRIDNKAVIGTVAKQLRDCYVFPDSGALFSARLLKLLQKGQYGQKLPDAEFARLVSADLERISRDKHLVFFLDLEMNANLREGDSEEEADRKWVEEEKKRNYGFRQATVLEGNVGYLDLRIFLHPETAAPKAVASMAFLSNCDAFIIDLRNNGGGWGEMVAFLSTYFFSAKEQVHLTSAYSRPEDKLTQSWTAQWVPGARFPDQPLYILTSRSTFSAAEEFCYNLKQLKRAVLVGETTRGGAHPVSYKPVGEKFVLMIPEMTSINPVSGGNWEGVGIIPDISAPAEKALSVAHLKALENLESCAQDTTVKAWFRWHHENCESEYHPVALPDNSLQPFVGKYGPIEVGRTEDGLYYCRGGRMKHTLRPLSQTLFADCDSDNIRVEFVLENGSVTALKMLTDDGGSSLYSRDE